MNRWESKANALWQAWTLVSGGPPPNPNALRLVLAQAQHETECGDDWDHSGNWGACDLRALNTAERVAFEAEILKVGMWLYPDGTYGFTHRPDSVGTIRGDSDPNSGPFHVWFFASSSDVQGAAFMLRAGVRQARGVLDNPQCDAIEYAQALYVDCCYFGGFHAGARPCGKRPLPLNAAEQANVLDYANAIRKILPSIDAGLATWVPPGAYGQIAESTIAGDNQSQNAGDEIANASVIEDATDPGTSNT